MNCSQNATCSLTPQGGLPWSQANNTWIFKPLNPRVSVYIFIRNYNSSNAHTSQTVQVFQTPFGKDYAPSVSQSASKWTQDQLVQNATVGASCNNVNALNDLAPGASGLGTCYVTTVFAAQVAIKITGAATQAGAVDNFDLAIVQETGTPAGQQPGSSTSTLAPVLQPPTTKNSQTVSAANTQIIISIPGVAGQRVYLFGITVFAAGGTVSCAFGPQVKDGVAGTSIFLADAGFIGTGARSISWPVPLASSVGNGMDILIAACGSGVTTTTGIQASQL